MPSSADVDRLREIVSAARGYLRAADAIDLDPKWVEEGDPRWVTLDAAAKRLTAAVDCAVYARREIAEVLAGFRPLVPCCHLHRDEGCCDPDDCGPCCSDCPTCPTLNPELRA